MNKKRCVPCGGSGKMMGGGMMLLDCDTCDGLGKVIVPDEDDIDYLAKNTEHYQKAKEEIKKIDDKISDDEAEKILDEEIEKQKPESFKKKKEK